MQGFLTFDVQFLPIQSGLKSSKSLILQHIVTCIEEIEDSSLVSS